MVTVMELCCVAPLDTLVIRGVSSMVQSWRPGPLLAPFSALLLGPGRMRLPFPQGPPCLKQPSPLLSPRGSLPCNYNTLIWGPVCSLPPLRQESLCPQCWPAPSMVPGTGQGPVNMCREVISASGVLILVGAGTPWVCVLEGSSACARVLSQG